MPKDISTPNLVALPITSQELGRGGFFAPPSQNRTIKEPNHYRVNKSASIGVQGYCKSFLGENIHFSISSYSVCRTFKAHNDTIADRSFEKGRNFM